MNDEVLTNIRLLLTRWYRDFNEPTPYETELDRDVREMASKDFPLKVIDAGIRRYRDTYMYGRTRNWAHLMKCCMEVNKATLNLMSAGMAADVFVQEMASGYIDAANTCPGHFERRVQLLGYGHNTADLIAATHRRIGDSVRYESTEWTIRRFIRAYNDLITENVVLPPIPALSSGTKTLKEIMNDKTAKRIAQLHDPTLDSTTHEKGEG